MIAAAFVIWTWFGSSDHIRIPCAPTEICAELWITPRDLKATPGQCTFTNYVLSTYGGASDAEFKPTRIDRPDGTFYHLVWKNDNRTALWPIHGRYGSWGECG